MMTVGEVDQALANRARADQDLVNRGRVDHQVLQEIGQVIIGRKFYCNLCLQLVSSDHFRSHTYSLLSKLLQMGLSLIR